MTRMRVRILGRVQGVGFRYFVVRRARSLDLTGCVRNLPDGSVEVEAEGDREALGTLLGALGQGPRGARVDEVQEEWSDGAPAYRDFEVAG